MPDRPLVFVPGLPASHLRRAGGDRFFLRALADLLTADHTAIIELLSGPDDITNASVVAEEPIRTGIRFLHFDLLKQARTLYEILEPLGYDTATENDEFTPFGWDWRLPVDEPRMLLRLLERLRLHRQATGRNAVVIVHSTGGLVLRALLLRHPEARDLIASVLAFGVPWAGTLAPLALFVAQEGFAFLAVEQAQQVLARSWAAFDLLPLAGAWPGPPPPLVVLRDSVGADVELDLLAERRWLPASQAAPMTLRALRTLGNRADAVRRLPLPAGVDVVNVAGFGAGTYRRAVLRPDGPAADPMARLRVEPLEKPVDHAGLDDGDGTIPWRSASWLQADRTFHIPVGFYPARNLAAFHNTLWTNPGGREILRHVLRGDALPNFVHVALDGDDVNLFGPVIRGRLVAQDGAGAALPGVTLRLDGGAPLPFTVVDDGRLGFALATGALRRTLDGKFFRFTLAVRSTGAPAAVERTFLLPTGS